MDLFKVERYGEQEKLVDSDDALQQFLSKIKRRKELSAVKKDSAVGTLKTSKALGNSLIGSTKSSDDGPAMTEKRKLEHSSPTSSVNLTSEQKDKSARKKKKKNPLVDNDSLSEKLNNHHLYSNHCNEKMKDEKIAVDDTHNSESLNNEDKHLLGKSVLIENNDNAENDDSQTFPTITTDNCDMYQVLTKQSNKKLLKFKRSLPRWLAEPTLIPADINLNRIECESVDFLSPATFNNMKEYNLSHFFPVQAKVIPQIIQQSCGKLNGFPPRDICVQAPTGSGKTLSYVLPIIDILSKNVVRNLYCLVVLPTKDLAMQVKSVFDHFSKGTNLKTALLSGARTFSKEQEKLVETSAAGSTSKVDIAVCTPGRLVDHLMATKGFTLNFLRFLVIDEADRLLSQDYSGWVSLVMQNRSRVHTMNLQGYKKCFHSMQKFLFSATLTQNPEKLASLHLYNPMYFMSTSWSDSSSLATEQIDSAKRDSNDGFVIPKELVEKMIVIELNEKPLEVVHIMVALHYKRVLCFTKSKDSTHRLCVLLKSFERFTTAEFSSDLTETQRKGIIRDFKCGNIDLLVSSDAMSRGMHVEDVNLVINYDTPNDSKTYVHRVGRTARAGAKGEAITFLAKKEVYHFKELRKKLLSASKLVVMKIKKDELTPYEQNYSAALSCLQNTIVSEKRTQLPGRQQKRFQQKLS